MSVFHFKHFDVINEQSSMKVNTDGVLLGACVSLRGSERRVLDAGTGTGTIALMLAQRLLPQRKKTLIPSRQEWKELRITGIDIDRDSAAEAQINFNASAWSDILEAKCLAMKDFVPDEKLDLIVSNPPYFDDSLLPPLERRMMARHTFGAALSFYSLVEYCTKFTNENGRLAVILPAEQEKKSISFAAANGMYPFRIMRIRTTPKKPFSRVILEFSKDADVSLIEEEFTIQDPSAFPENRNGYTPEYIKLTRDYYLEEYLIKTKEK